MNEHSTALLNQAKEIRLIANDLIHEVNFFKERIDNGNEPTWKRIREGLSNIEVVVSALRARFGDDK